MHLQQELQNRWFIKQITNENILSEFEKGGQKFYCWYDPTADSLHLGHMVTIMASVNFMKKWNTFVMLIWGATWMIGDPSFKDSERSFLDEKTLEHNQNKITQQVQKILTNLQKISWKNLSFEVVNNYDFYKNMSVLDFLRNVGKYITVNTMIAKETIKKRVEDPEKSISFTEFSYTLLQWFDFLKLYKDSWVTLQLAGSDQRWNITTWTEIIRKSLNAEAHWITIPLILDSNWKKFGKSEWNAIWLDPDKNSPYTIYQYFMNTNDEDIERFLKLFTLLDLEEIANIDKAHKEKPENRYWQQQLAKYVTETIFDKEYSEQAEKISGILFGQNNKMEVIQKMSKDDLTALQKETGWMGISIQDENKLTEICTKLWISSSNWEAKKLISSNSIYCNEKLITDINFLVSKEYFVNWVVLIRKWKKVFKLINLVR